MICGLNLRQNRSQNKLACKNAMRGGHRSCSPDFGLLTFSNSTVIYELKKGERYENT